MAKSGRPKCNPNDLHTITIGPKYRWPMPAAQRKKRKGGKITLTIPMPPYLYEELRLEAIERKMTLRAVAVECLEAGRAP